MEQQDPISTLHHKRKLATKKGAGEYVKQIEQPRAGKRIQFRQVGLLSVAGRQGCVQRRAAVGAEACPKVLKEEAHSTQREGERGNRMEQSGGFSGWWQEDQLRACDKELYQGHSSGNRREEICKYS